MKLDRSQEMLIRSVAVSLRAAATTLESLIVREEPGDELRCPKCKSTQLSEAGGDTLVCADCNHNMTVQEAS
jgi:hypothetical protein